MKRRLSPLAAVVLLASVMAPPARAAGPVDCTLQYSLSGWSVFYQTASGSGTVTCGDGQTLPVRIRAKGGGLTFGKSRVDGSGVFSGVYDIRDVLGAYASSEAHVGLAKSARATAMTKGSVSLALVGRGQGWDLGLAFGKFVIEP